METIFIVALAIVCLYFVFKDDNNDDDFPKNYHNQSYYL